MTKPSLNQPFTDPDSGLQITRISATNPPDWTQVEYSTINPFSSDPRDPHILLIKRDHFGLWNSTGFLHDLPMISASSEPRWSLADPGVLYYHDAPGNVLTALDILTSTAHTVRQFTEYSAIRIGNGEGDISEDGDHFAIVGDRADGSGTEIFVYQLSTDTKYRILNTAGHSLDSVYITPDNNVLVSWNEKGTRPFKGIQLYDKNGTYLRQIANANGHKDVGRDKYGNEVLFWSTSDENPVTLPDYPNGIVMIDLATGSQTGLLSLPWAEAVHICGNATKVTGKLYIETYVSPTVSPMPVYGNKILEIAVDRSGVKIVCDHHSTQGSYNEQPRVAVNADGTLAVFGSDWVDTTDPNYEDVYKIELKSRSELDVQLTLQDHEVRIKELEGV